MPSRRRYTWNRWAHPYIPASKWDVYNQYDLWEADPPPLSSIAGGWTKRAIRQIRLDWDAPGFNAGIDVNETTQEWLDAAVKNQPSPNPQPFQSEIVWPSGYDTLQITVKRAY